MMRLMPLRSVHHRCACWHHDASRSSGLHRVHHRRPRPAVRGRHRSCQGRAGLGHVTRLSWQPAALVAPGASPGGRSRGRQLARQPRARRRAAVARTWPARVTVAGRRTHLTWTCYAAGQTRSRDHQPGEQRPGALLRLGIQRGWNIALYQLTWSARAQRGPTTCPGNSRQVTTILASW
jgi:hypothetical protein